MDWYKRLESIRFEQRYSVLRMLDKVYLLQQESCSLMSQQCACSFQFQPPQPDRIQPQIACRMRTTFLGVCWVSAIGCPWQRQACWTYLITNACFTARFSQQTTLHKTFALLKMFHMMTSPWQASATQLIMDISSQCRLRLTSQWVCTNHLSVLSLLLNIISTLI